MPSPTVAAILLWTREALAQVPLPRDDRAWLTLDDKVHACIQAAFDEVRMCRPTFHEHLGATTRQHVGLEYQHLRLGEEFFHYTHPCGSREEATRQLCIRFGEDLQKERARDSALPVVEATWVDLPPEEVAALLDSAWQHALVQALRTHAGLTP